MKFEKMQEFKKPFYSPQPDGEGLINHDLTKVYSIVENKTFYIKGFERTIIEKYEFKNNAEALEFENKWYQNIKNVLDANINFLSELYGNNIQKYQMSMLRLQNNLKKFFKDNQSKGYIFK